MKCRVTLIMIVITVLLIASLGLVGIHEENSFTGVARAEDADNITYTWGNPDAHLIRVPAGLDEDGNTIYYPVMDTPVGIMSDGSSLNELNDIGFRGGSDQWLEAIYLSTGDVGKGVVDISPVDGSQSLPSADELLPGHHSRISSAIPMGMGPVNSSVVIYELRQDDGGPKGHSGNVYITTTTGNIIAIRAVVDYNPSVSGDQLFPIDYSLLWTYHMEGSISESASIYYGDPFTETDDVILVASDSGVVYAFSPDTGDVLWNRNLDGSGFFTPISISKSDMTIAASSDGRIYALDIEDGNVLWKHDYEVHFTSVAVDYFARTYSGLGSESVDNDSLLFAGTSDGRLYGIRMYDSNVSEEKAGDVAHILEIPGAKGHALGEIFMSPGLDPWILVGANRGSDAGIIYCIDTERLEEDECPIVWYYDEVSGGVSSRPAYFDNRYVFFVTDNGHLYSVKVSDGSILDVDVMEGKNMNTPLVAYQIPGADPLINHHLIVSSKDGWMSQFHYSDGFEIQSKTGCDIDSGTESNNSISFGIPIYAGSVAVAVAIFSMYRKRK